jgi:hypothetical protein
VIQRGSWEFVARCLIFGAGVGAFAFAFVSGVWQLLAISAVAYFLLRGS